MFIQTWYKVVSANSVKFARVFLRILESHVVRCSMLKALLLSVRSSDNCRYAKIALVPFSVRTVWTTKYDTKVHHNAKRSTVNTLLLQTSAIISLCLLVLQFARSHDMMWQLDWVYWGKNLVTPTPLFQSESVFVDAVGKRVPVKFLQESLPLFWPQNTS